MTHYIYSCLCENSYQFLDPYYTVFFFGKQIGIVICRHQILVVRFYKFLIGFDN